jgi:hypothetical protein
MSALQHGALARFVCNDGGRAAAGFKGRTGDCACRAIAIATGKPYREVYDGLNGLCALLRLNHGGCAWLGEIRGTVGSETGIPGEVINLYLGPLGWQWTSTDDHATHPYLSSVGWNPAPTKAARLHRWDLPLGRLVVLLRNHLVAVIDHVVHDHGEHWRGRRAVHGYWTLKEESHG